MPPVVAGRCRLQFLLPVVAAITFASVSLAAPEPITLREHKGWVGGVTFSPDGKILATASADGTVKFWDSATGKLQETWQAHDDIVSAVAFAQNGKQFATASFDGTAKVWTAAKPGEPVHTFGGMRGAVLTVAFNPNGRALAVGGIDGTVRVWELDGKGEPAPRVQRTHKSWVNAIAYRPDGFGLASGSSDNEIWFNPAIGKLVIVRPKLAEVRSVAYSPDGKWLATGTRYGITKVWDEAGDEVASMKGKGGDVWAVAFSHDGKLLAVADGDWNKPSDIVLYDTKTWKERTRLKHTNEVLCVAFHPKKSILAAGAWDKTTKVWDLTAVEEKPLPNPFPRGREAKALRVFAPNLTKEKGDDAKRGVAIPHNREPTAKRNRMRRLSEVRRGNRIAGKKAFRCVVGLLNTKAFVASIDSGGLLSSSRWLHLRLGS